jgi:hypothetical protein
MLPSMGLPALRGPVQRSWSGGRNPALFTRKHPSLARRSDLASGDADRDLAQDHAGLLAAYNSAESDPVEEGIPDHILAAALVLADGTHVLLFTWPDLPSGHLSSGHGTRPTPGRPCKRTWFDRLTCDEMLQLVTPSLELFERTYLEPPTTTVTPP